jgi:kynurenine formamidase
MAAEKDERSRAVSRPAYRELANGNARGVFGAEDELGCLNLLTPERTAAAAALIKTGLSIGLNGSLKDWPHPGLFGRSAPVHHILRYEGLGRDDYYDGFYPQLGSQWDHFLHVGDPESGTFYNGTLDEAVGVAAWARAGIVGRAVLLDVAAWAARLGRPLDFRQRSEISVADLESCAAAQRTSIEEGTILLVRVGWEEAYSRLSADDRAELASSPLAHPGLEASRQMAGRLWDWGVAAVASDNPALEAWPPSPEVYLHHHLLGRLGIPIGELWLLDDLAAACAREDRYEFFLVSAPLNSSGGVGSTANAVAIL